MSGFWYPYDVTIAPGLQVDDLYLLWVSYYIPYYTNFDSRRLVHKVLQDIDITNSRTYLRSEQLRVPLLKGILGRALESDPRVGEYQLRGC